MRVNRRPPNETMVLFETFDGCVIEWRSQIGGRSVCPEIPVCFRFLVRFPRSKQTINPVIERFQASLDRWIVVKQAAGIIVKERRRRPNAYKRRRSVITATVTRWLPFNVLLRIRIP